ncbi:hypothetical protein HanXRQr2_Chr10g0463661 [Helianthus annuus]|uniref:Uncharacterized protein n=1 Tax=Helianthus annuus TaxID=4232 RepID=A0A9K3N5S0_HELAN|nr:hypothetical protein HanXRQr2_Chr10g0463661 [Helianthus annuus]KAJ0885643.1 hypothetical protein HanPSC8_Chr10g0447461 [Helianthus annuus]
MGYNSTDGYLEILDELSDDQYSLPEDMINSLLGYVKSIYRSDSQNNYAKPMLWIGMYIAIASLVCILAMVADLLHGLRSRKLWFPCRFFRINAAYLSLIAIAMKLPVDLSGSMPGNVDQAGKLGSMAFMCTMMHVRNHWIMAGSGSPEFITACFRTTSASGVICVLVTVLHTLTISWTIKSGWGKDDFDSDYSWSMKVILIVQFIGVVIGTIAPLARCFATLSFQVSSDIISKYFKVFEVEGYWTSKLYEWRRASIKLPFRSRPKLEVVTESLKRIILRPCMELQEGVVVLCKIISLVPFVFMICIVYCKCCLKWLVKADNFDENKDLRQYVLPLENEMELADRTLDRLSKSVNRLIEKGEKARPQDLEILIKNSDSGLKGVAKFDHIDHHRVPSLLSKVQDQEFWSLPVVSLTTIAISLLEKESNEVKSLLKSVWEGLRYVTLVEESLNVTDDNVSLQKEADTLWKEVLYDQKWLGIDIPFSKEKSAKHFVECLGRDVGDSPDPAKTAQKIVEWFRDTSKNIDKIKGGMDDDPIHRSVCANSMYHITKTILLTYEANVDDSVSRKNLFDSLSSMIADIIAACLTNLPQVIKKKCHNSAIEKWEGSVKDAALLLGETKEIIKTLYEDHGKIISGMNPSDLPFINKWRAHLGNP